MAMGEMLEQVRMGHERVARRVNLRLEEAASHPRIQAVVKHPRVREAWQFAQKHNLFQVISRVMLGLYFLNMAYYSVDLYFNYNFGDTEGIDWLSLLRVPVAICFICNYKPELTGPALVLFSGWDCLRIFRHQVHRWYTNNTVIVNELMVKKMAIFGSCLLAIVEQFKGKITFTGDIDPNAGTQKNKKQSVILLLARLFICSLFLYIGLLEVGRQIHTVGHWYSTASGGTAYRRPEGDGHDQIFFKVLQLFLSVPILLGYNSSLSSVLLSSSLVLEAVTQWQFIGVNIPNWKYYPIHARDHFFTNLAVAGGLLFLSGFGAGMYSLDTWLKKRE
mmetsp:Transcript_14024/g.39853  ORF Transcript_14024/g.39853 Transcript_14024/m.39853 type:complete len:333 (-) Transcript_14024:37-1035(-)|eukprot:CAMPEP_0119135546 /NCGR_PEP_ID=MMETSP1310-20130426/19496_1 /TAXON_ID=464262 /ORGANISM="Genus nov. species nov., Strain RCC2339" /LENGTH=332 /DNA_ID=CAMNT_0007126439 /DNA_START=173 /DNA_END=1171 /DNA_ORIENTATION=+